jgi:hypothetical protein
VVAGYLVIVFLQAGSFGDNLGGRSDRIVVAALSDRIHSIGIGIGIGIGIKKSARVRFRLR